MQRRALILAAASLAALLLLVLLPSLGDAAMRWEKTAPVRGATLAVDQVRPGSAPPGVRVPSGRPPHSARGASAAPAVVDAGMTFNLLGAVGRHDASRGVLPQGDAGETKSAGASITVRTSLDGAAWSEWVTLPLASAEGDVGPERLVGEPCWVGEARYVQFVHGGPVNDLKLMFVNSLGETTVVDRAKGALGRVVAAVARFARPHAADAATTKPAIITRAQWGANEKLKRAAPEYAPVRMAFIHHTVSGNGYGRDQAKAVVRGIYYYHVRGAGYNDIGYNFLIDRFGRIYEGRYGGVARGVVGAQTLGFNTNSTGIAFIGTFSSVKPSPAARAALVKLLAWKLDVNYVNPTSTATMTCRATQKYKNGQKVKFKAISGHRDANFTACPGSPTYSLLPSVRTSVAATGRPKIFNPRVSARLITPNDDGVTDTTTVRFSASETVSWRIAVSNADGVVVRSWAASGSSAKRVWDGKTADGVVVPDGAYTVRMTARSSRGSARPAVSRVMVDALPPSIDDAVATPATSLRRADGRRQPVQISYTVSEPAKTRVSIRRPGGKPAALVNDWSAISAQPRAVKWNGTVSFAGVKIPAPDGQYTVLIQARDVVGNLARLSLPVTCESDPAQWGDGSVFVTKALAGLRVPRGQKAVFRYMAVLAPPQGSPASATTAEAVTLKVRDADGVWRYTRRIADVPLNVAQTHTWSRVGLPRGTYRYYIYARLADGTKAQLVGSAKLVVR